MKKTCPVALDLGLSGDLNFQEAEKICKDAADKGLKISFELNFGLFSNLKKPLSNSFQYLSFELSLKHFIETLWNQYHTQVKEVILYQCSLDFSEDFALMKAKSKIFKVGLKINF